MRDFNHGLIGDCRLETTESIGDLQIWLWDTTYVPRSPGSVVDTGFDWVVAMSASLVSFSLGGGAAVSRTFVDAFQQLFHHVPPKHNVLDPLQALRAVAALVSVSRAALSSCSVVGL